MRSLLSSVILLVALVGGGDVAKAATLIVGWDEFPFGGGSFPSGYAGLEWSGFHFSSVLNGYGFANAAVSPPNSAWNADGLASFSAPTAFDVNSVYLTGVFRDGVQVQVDGYLGASLLYSNTFTVYTTQATFFELNYLGVDEVVFNSFGGTPVYAGGGPNFAMDNLTITTAPEPASSMLIGLVIAGLAGARRRRSRRAILAFSPSP